MPVMSALLLAAALGADPLVPGDHVRNLVVDDLERIYRVHVPPKYDPEQPTPLVLALHGAAMNGQMMEWFSGLSEKADEAGFIVAYPNGTGRDPLLTWNAGWFNNRDDRVDDVEFIRQLLDDLATVVKLDEKRIYACGMSNGGMMCYRLAAELSERIAAIAPVAGTIALKESQPKRPVPVIHFHGTRDEIVPFEFKRARLASLMRIKGVNESIQTWVKLDGCREMPETDTLSRPDDELKVTRHAYCGGKEGAEVVLIEIEGGGHTWPGQPAPVIFLGKSAMNLSANDLIWEFFQKHPLK
jgi:polyhydroxybutyrate depolymerase